MKKNQLFLIAIITFVAALFFICVYSNKNDNIYDSNIELTPQMEQNIPRIIHVLSDEENIATTSHYVAPSEITPFPKEAIRDLIHVQNLDPFFETTNEPSYHDKTTWESIFFQTIDRVSEAANWPPLREVGVPSGALEVRIWIGFGLSHLQALRLCRHDGKWTGFYTSEIFQFGKLIRDGDEWRMTYTAYQPSLQILTLTPQTNWKNLWNKIKELGILTLPDASTLPNNKPVLDGVCYVIEINDGGQYRTYMYDNPDCQEHPEAVKLLQIIKTLRYEFIKSLPKNDPPWYYWY